MRPNRFREKLNAGEPTLGTQVCLAVAERRRVDRPLGLLRLCRVPGRVHRLRPCRCSTSSGAPSTGFDGFTAMLKVGPGGRGRSSRSGASAPGSRASTSPMSETPTTRGRCVSAVRAETPGTGGRYGAGGPQVRPSSSSTAPAREYVQALDDVVVVLMIEKARGGREPGCDPGCPRRRHGHLRRERLLDEHRQAGRGPRPRDHEGCATTCTAERWRWACSLAPSSAPSTTPRPCSTSAFRHFSIGSDLLILYAWWQENSKAMRDMVERAQT